MQDEEVKTRYGVTLEKNAKKKRISFSGRKSVREFHTEEKPKSWNYSYEISDHNNMSQNISTHMNYKEVDGMQLYSIENDGERANSIELEARPRAAPIELTSRKFEEAMNCSFNHILENKEKVPGEKIFVNNDTALEISMELNNPIKCQDSTWIYTSTITTKGSPQLHSPTLYNKYKRENVARIKCVSPPKTLTEQNETSQGRPSLNMPSIKPTTKPSKLSMRELNAAIGDGKIIVFPNQKVDTSVKCGDDIILSNSHVTESKVGNCIQHDDVKECTDTVPIECQRARHIDENNSYGYSESEDITLSTSFMANEKGSVRNILEINSKRNECKASNDTILPGAVELAFKPYSSKALTSPSALNHTPQLQYDRDGNSSLDGTLYAVQDMSLNITNFGLTKWDLPRILPSDMRKLDANDLSQTIGVDMSSEMNMKVMKNRNTIYFNEDTESLNTDTACMLKNNKFEPKNNNDVDINDSDSLILNLKEVRQATFSSNCERRIEGTPHRSRSLFEFVNLEKETEKSGGISNGHQEYKNFQINEMQITEYPTHVSKSLNEKGFKLNDSKWGGKMLNVFDDGRATDVLDKSLVLSPSWNSISSKRLTENLTPNLPLPKRRHTLVFRDCAMEESIIFSDKIDMGELDSANGTCSHLFKKTYLQNNIYVMNPKDTQVLNSLSKASALKMVVANQSHQNKVESLDSIDVARHSLILPNAIICETENYKSFADESDNDPITISDTSLHNQIQLTVGKIDNQCLTGLSKNSSVKNTPIYRRCKCCQKSISDGVESFELPSTTQLPSLSLCRLEKLRKHSNLEDAHEYWQRRSFEKKGNFLSKSTKQSNGLYEQSWDYINCIDINTFQDTIEVFKRTLEQINELDMFTQFQEDSFFQHLSGLLRSNLPSWILNYQLKGKGIIQFHNRKLVSCVIELFSNDKNQLGGELFIQGVALHKALLKHWKPIDYILHDALDVSSKVILSSFQSGNTKSVELFELLKLIDERCEWVLKDGIDLWQLISKMRAALIRQSNRIIVRKVVRHVVNEGEFHYPFVTTNEFEIELRNIRTLSFNNIISPPLYVFSEELQSLPRGIDFLKVFLEDPTRYLQLRTA